MEYIAILEDEHIVRVSGKPCLHCFDGLMNDYFIPVKERKTGEWEYEYDNGVSAVYHCSVCGRKLVVLRDDTVENYPYCHCGVEMRGAEND